jgi:hypothetical protein
LSVLVFLLVFVFLLVLLPTLRSDDASRPSEKDGTLVVLVTWGDANDTPANDVYVEAYGFVRQYGSEKSFVLKSPNAGRYEASLPPGVYDVFVSEGISIPSCKRVLVSAGSTSSWTLKLETDHVYTEK